MADWSSEESQLRGLVLELPGAPHHAIGQASQAGHLQAKALACGPLFNLVEKHNRLAMLHGADMQVGSALELFWKAGELEVMGGKKAEAAVFHGQARGDRLGQGQAIDGGGATPNLVHEHQAVWAASMQNQSSLCHLDHEG